MEQRRNLELSWQHLSRFLSFRFDGYRAGWRGLLDHALEIALRKKPTLIPHNREVTISCWVRGVPSDISELELHTEQAHPFHRLKRNRRVA